jgi:hypothetical protein
MTGVTRVQVVQMGVDTASNTTNRSKVFNSPITAGNFMVVAFSSHNSNPGNYTVSDDKSNTWIKLDDGTAWDSSGGRGTSVYYALANAAAQAGAPTVTLNKNGISAGCVGLMMELNCPSGTFLDCASVTALPNVGGTSFNVNIGPTSYDHNMVFAVGGGPEASYQTFTPTAGWTSLDNQSNTAASIQQSVIYKDTTTTGTFTPGWTTGGADAVAIVAVVARGTTTAPTITGVSSATPNYQGSLIITGVNFGASQGTGSVSLGGVAQTVTAWSDTSITVTVARGTNKYGAALNLIVTVNGGATSNTFAGVTAILPQSGWDYVDLTTPNATSANRITATADVASGDQIAWNTASSQVTCYADATFSAGAAVTSFGVEAWFTGNGWGSTATQTSSQLRQSRQSAASSSAASRVSAASLSPTSSPSVASPSSAQPSTDPPRPFSPSGRRPQGLRSRRTEITGTPRRE